MEAPAAAAPAPAPAPPAPAQSGFAAFASRAGASLSSSLRSAAALPTAALSATTAALSGVGAEAAALTSALSSVAGRVSADVAAEVAPRADRGAREREMLFRARDVADAADAVARGGLAREVEYARTSTALYASVLKDVQGVKGDVVALGATVEGLADGISGARLVAARLAE